MLRPVCSLIQTHTPSVSPAILQSESAYASETPIDQNISYPFSEREKRVPSLGGQRLEPLMLALHSLWQISIPGYCGMHT